MDTQISGAGFVATRMDDGLGNGVAARNIPFNGIPAKMSSSWPIDAFIDLGHITVRDDAEMAQLLPIYRIFIAPSPSTPSCDSCPV